MEIRNETPFEAGLVLLMDKDGAEQLHVVLKATFAFTETGKLSIAEEQQPIAPAETYHGDPTTSSIKQEAELTPLKPGTDLFLLGHAWAPARGARVGQVGFRVGENVKTAKIFGNRVWVRGVAGAAMSSPEPFETIPLLYENAFGGQDLSASDPAKHDREARNPVGRGFRAKHSALPWEGEPLPNIEDPNGLLTSLGGRSNPVGFGPVGRAWEPRVRYAGTYDQAWIEQRMPLLPQDFDERFHNAAPPDLVAAGHPQGGEWVDVVGCTPNGRVYFQLPVVQPRIEVLVGGRRVELQGTCDTVTVDTAAMQLRMLWKAATRVHREVPVLKRITCRLEGAAA